MGSARHEDLVRERVAAGDLDEALRVAMRVYGDSVLEYLRRLCEREADAQDLLQVVFVQAYRDLRKFRGGSLRGWLLKIAHNRAVDHFRANAREGRRLHAVQSHGARDRRSPISARLEQRQIIQRCFTELPERTREAVRLRHVQGLRYRAMARKLGASEESLQMLVARAVKSLRSCIDRLGAAT